MFLARPYQGRSRLEAHWSFRGYFGPGTATRIFPESSQRSSWCSCARVFGPCRYSAFFHVFQLQGTWRSWIQHSSSSESAELSGAGTLVIEVSQCNTWPKATQSSLQFFFFFSGSSLKKVITCLKLVFLFEDFCGHLAIFFSGGLHIIFFLFASARWTCFIFI